MTGPAKHYPCLPPAILALASLALFACTSSRTGPVSFVFALPAGTVAEPFAAEVWAEVELPSGETMRLPAYYDGNSRFAVRTPAAAAGTYHLRNVLLTTDGAPAAVSATSVTPAAVSVVKPQAQTMVGLDPEDPRRLAHMDGEAYFPVGANLAWATSRNVTRSYRSDFAAFAAADLNWTRIWMCHWGQLNLDWLRGDLTRSPPPGRLDPEVARRWDEIVQRAEQEGIYIQMVLQHHGQYSTTVNSNWDENPWNAANPQGFLETPEEFFTSPRARELTKRKYRYIVARWGYSPAILAWELFNEVHWVDALRLKENAAAVAAWHAEMAGYLRSIDAHGHLVTTSCDPVTSPLFAGMDFLQPHLYAVNMLVSVQQYDLDPDALRRPVFYGEFGEDQMPVDPEVRRAASHLVPPVWASVMGTGTYAAQPWEGHRIHRAGRMGELGAIARFAADTKLAERAELTHFAPLVSSNDRLPLQVSAGQNWVRQPAPTVAIPVDGRIALDLARIPGVIVGSPSSISEGYPQKFTLQIDSPQETRARIELEHTGVRGASMRVLLDDQPVAAHTWPPGSSDDQNAEVTFSIPSGPRTIVVENNGGADAIAFATLELDLEVPIIAATGKRTSDFLMLWLWHREGVYAAVPPAASVATVELEDVSAGSWNITWWDSINGTPVTTQVIDHPGGTLLLPTPPISRHAAVTLEQVSP